MKYVFMFALLLVSFSLLGQNRSLSFYLGGQIPSEIAFLDFTSEGPDDVFVPGIVLGSSIEFNKPRIGFRADLDFTSNGMKDFEKGSDQFTFDGDLYNGYLRMYFQYHIVRKEDRPVFSLGLGPGYVVSSVPETTFSSIVIGSDAIVLARRLESSFALCSSLRMMYPISNKISFYGALNNDFIGLYAARETVIYTNLNLGISMHF